MENLICHVVWVYVVLPNSLQPQKNGINQLKCTSKDMKKDYKTSPYLTNENKVVLKIMRITEYILSQAKAMRKYICKSYRTLMQE